MDALLGEFIAVVPTMVVALLFWKISKENITGWGCLIGGLIGVAIGTILFNSFWFIFPAIFAIGGGIIELNIIR